MQALDALKKFFQEEKPTQDPLVVGFSAGGDSTALVVGLLALNIPNVHLAYFDHQEDSEETKSLVEKRAKDWSIPLHKGSMSWRSFSENEQRQYRYVFYKELYAKIGAQALLLGHHKDDVVETVLKRVLEGAHLSSLHGMRARSEWQGMQIWRPFLKVQKKKLLYFLQNQGEVWVDDPGNQNPRFLRARMRTQLLRSLQDMFGKGFTDSLGRVAEQSQEMYAYLSKKAQPLCKVEGPFGTFWELPPEPVEARFLLRRILQERSIVWSSADLDKALSLLRLGVANRTLSHGFYVDRGLLFFLRNECEYERVTLKIENTPPKYVGWKGAWQGVGWMRISQDQEIDNFEVVPSNSSAFSKLWSKHKVPFFFRRIFPLVKAKKKGYFEFLSGKYDHWLPAETQCLVLRVQVPSDEGLCK